MSNENSQQSAFPLVYDGNSAAPFCHDGLTKREYFAAMAMQGILANFYQDYRNAEDDFDILAKVSINAADELLKKLES